MSNITDEEIIKKCAKILFENHNPDIDESSVIGQRLISGFLHDLEFLSHYFDIKPRSTLQNKVSDVSAEEVIQDIEGLAIYIEDIFKYYILHDGKDAGNLWIQFNDKFNTFKKKIFNDSIVNKKDSFNYGYDEEQHDSIYKENQELKKELESLKEYASKNKVSDVSAEEIDLASQRAYPIVSGLSNFDALMKREAFKNGIKWYASIVNERKDIPADKLNDLDEILANFEDWMHGEDGKKITKARQLIIELKRFERKDNVVNDWISVEDKLPKFNDMFSDRVLGCDIKTGTIKVVSLFKSYEGRYLGYNTTREEFMNEVTHWMPLPKPPIESQPKK